MSALADRFIGSVVAGVLDHVLHRHPVESPLGPIIKNGDFEGPVDGWLPTYTWLERHGVGGTVSK